MQRRYGNFKLAPSSFKALDGATGLFEAIVAVFGNVDRAGDKILPGAFRGSLERWRRKGRPIPVIFAHQWDNLDAHIGQVLEARETDKGLYVKGQLELDEPFARRVWEKMRKGLLAEFSFAYDVLKSKFKDGVNELHELELLEVGPCLVGMNPETELLAVKAGRWGDGALLGSPAAVLAALELEAMGVLDAGRQLTPGSALAEVSRLAAASAGKSGDGSSGRDVAVSRLEAAIAAVAASADCSPAYARAVVEGQVATDIRQLEAQHPYLPRPAAEIVLAWWLAPAA